MAARLQSVSQPMEKPVHLRVRDVAEKEACQHGIKGPVFQRQLRGRPPRLKPGNGLNTMLARFRTALTKHVPRLVHERDRRTISSVKLKPVARSAGHIQDAASAVFPNEPPKGPGFLHVQLRVRDRSGRPAQRVDLVELGRPLVVILVHALPQARVHGWIPFRSNLQDAALRRECPGYPKCKTVY